MTEQRLCLTCSTPLLVGSGKILGESLGLRDYGCPCCEWAISKDGGVFVCRSGQEARDVLAAMGVKREDAQ